MTSDNIAEYVGENNQFTEKPVTEYPPVIQDNTVTTKDYLYSNNIDTDLLVVIGGLIVILFLMMLIMYFINSLRHKELTEILTKISFPEKSGSNLLKPEAVSCNLLSLCVLAPVFCTPRKLAEVSREIIVASAQEIAWTPGSSRIDGHQAENITWAISSQSPADKYDLINKTSCVSPDSGRFYEPDTVLDHRERVKISWQTFINGCIYWWCTSLEGMRDLIKSQPVYEIQYYGKTFRMNAAQVLHDKYMIWCGEQLWSAFVLASVVALVICLITFFVVSWILGRQGKQQSENEVTGGRQLTDNPKDVARMLKKDGKDSDIRIGDLPIIRDSEIQNFCLHGTVGAGKSEVIRRLANYARQRGDMVVIYDRSGEFVKSYYDPSIDKILNPLDARCAAWDLWKECLTQPDFDNTANTLIPMGTKEDPFWQGSGRTIFAEAAYLMRNDPNRSYSKLVDTLLSIKIEKLRTFLRNSPAANLVEEKIEKTAISIRAVLTNYVKAIRYLQGIEHNGDPFTRR